MEDGHDDVGGVGLEVPAQRLAGVGPPVAIGAESRERRRHFETDAAHVVVAVLHLLGKADQVADAIKRYEIDPDAPDPRWA